MKFYKIFFCFLFVVIESFYGYAVTLMSYEYWIDNDFNGHKTVFSSQEDIFTSFDLTSYRCGVHFFNIRFTNTDGEISSPIRYLFYIPEIAPSTQKLSSYEYWLDDDYTNKVSGKGTEEEQSFIIDLKSIDAGLHFLNYRAFADNGVVSIPSRYLFYIPDAVPSIQNLSSYEYWLDDDYDGKTTVVDSNEDQTFIIDISELESGVHFLNYRAFTDNGVHGAPSRYLFYIPDRSTVVDNRISGYEYSFNDKTTFVPIPPCEEYEMNATVIQLPDIKEVAYINDKCSFTFADDRVAMNQIANVSFLLRFSNVGGELSMPLSMDYEEEYSITKDVVDLKLQKSILLDKVTSGDFQAVKFEIPSSAVYYLRATQSCEMYILDSNGKRQAAISADKLLKTHAQSLAVGTYYGIIFNTLTDIENTDKAVGLCLMTTNNSVATPEITYENEIVKISCIQDDAVIYYTLDGTTPDETSTRYTSEFRLNHNAEIKAIAKASDYADSFVATLKIDSYKVDKPIIQFANLRIYITCTTPESKIYYTIDGSDPAVNGQLYTDAFTMMSNCTVRAIAKRDNYNNSDVEVYYLDISNVKCATPEMSVSGNLLTMTTISENASIYYTTDGSVPSNRSNLYKSPILLEHNALYRAITVKAGEIDSDVAEYNVDWFKAEIPSFSFENGLLTISCNTPGSVIYYEIGGSVPTSNSQKYVSPLSLSDNRVVRAFATASGFNDSDVVSYSPSSFTCDTPTIAFDGRAITLSTATPNATIYYTIDGNDPDAKSEIYRSEVILPGLCTVKAMAVCDDMNNSSVVSYVIPCYYNNESVYMKIPGSMSKAFEWCRGIPQIDELKICGDIADEDFECIRQFTSVRHLDLSAVSLSSIPDKAFANMNFLTLEMPECGFVTGSKLLSGCTELAALTWNSNTIIPIDILDGQKLPNMLLFVKYASIANVDFGNIVVNGVADNIVLTDSEVSNFYSPRQFLAQQISYAHTYLQETGYDRCAGWESIALPFAPTSISHETQGEISPFAANDSDKKKFWLCELSSSGFVSAPSIEANTPYIIAMPNSDRYSDEYILKGVVTFSGKNVIVEASNEINISYKGDNSFVPNFIVTDKDKCMTLNVGETYNGYAPGNLFAHSLRDAHPFEAYVTNASLVHTPRKVLHIFFDSSESEMILADNPVNVISDGTRLKVSGLKEGDIIDIFNIAGVNIVHETADNSEIYVEKPETGTVIITVMRKGSRIYTDKYCFY